VDNFLVAEAEAKLLQAERMEREFYRLKIPRSSHWIKQGQQELRRLEQQRHDAVTYSRMENIADIQVPQFDTVVSLPTNGGQLPNSRFMFGLMLQFEGRAVYAATGPTGVLADGVQALMERIIVQGYSRPRAAQEQFINVRGSDMHIWDYLYTTHLGLQTPAALATGLTTNDIRFNVYIPFTPLHLPIAQQAQYLLDCPNYDNLTLQIQMGDDFSIFTGQTAGAVAWHAFGLGTGNPRVRVSGIFAQAGPSMFQNVLPGRIWRYFFENTTGNIVAGAIGSREFNVPRGYTIRSLMLKTGTKATTTTAGNNVYSALSNTIYQNIQFLFGINRPIRYFVDMFNPQEQFCNNIGFTTAPPTGYMVIDFAQLGLQQECLNLSGAIAGPTGDIDTFIQADIPTGAANQADNMMVEEFRGQYSVVQSGS
jgi:hypothetical protein